jgi:DNA-binding response OmpR family regulator
MHKRVLYIANSLDNAYKFQRVLMELDVEIGAGSTEQIKKLLAPEADPNLIIFEARFTARQHLEEVETLAENHNCPLLIIVDQEDIESLSLPERIASDFVVNGAGEDECLMRIVRLLGIEATGSSQNCIEIDDMVLNLSTYQVTVAGEPIDLTYLEYTLLAFLAQNPNHTFTRDVLLQNVWGFDYYGGSRTVDVHVRRIRAKIGPHLAPHLETVRGVGYLWNTL